MGERQTLQIIPRLASVQEALDFISEWGAQYGLGENEIYHCHLSVDEIITNVVEHGFEFDEQAGFIRIEIESIEGGVIIEVIDNAPLFNPLMHPTPDPSLPLLEREGGGWGIHFVRKFMDAVTYHSTGGLNRLRMIKQHRDEAE